MSELVRVDGAIGGGQILRSALSLSALTGRAFAIDRIRKRRERPGLMRQHLTAVRAAAHMPSRGAKRTRSRVSRQQPRT